jgi:hypothetical protein
VFRRFAERLALCGWVIALIVAAQGWVPAGAEWYAGAGRSLWSPCGSAMCACPADAKTPVQRAAAAEAAVCCDEPPAAETADGGEPGLPLLVALGGERRDGDPASSMPEALVLQLPATPCAEIDRVFVTGREAAPDSSLASLAGPSVPAPPPRA